MDEAISTSLKEAESTLIEAAQIITGKAKSLQRIRHYFTREQSKILKEAFKESSYLDLKRCKNLMAAIGETNRKKIMVWFTNQRQKKKKEWTWGHSRQRAAARIRQEDEANASSGLLDTHKNTDDHRGTLPNQPYLSYKHGRKKLPFSNLSKYKQIGVDSANTRHVFAARKPKLKYKYPRGPWKKNRVPPRMLPVPKVEDNAFMGPPDIILPITELNPLLTCALCKGYLYNSATITECLHSFCKLCIIKHVQKNIHCPTCKTLIHPSNPYANIKLDYTVQDIVNKIFPFVEIEEKKREKEFYVSRGLQYPPKQPSPPTPPPTTEPAIPVNTVQIASESEGSEQEEESDIPPNWTSVMLQYAGSTPGLGTFKPVEKNYLRVPAEITIGQICTLITKKMDLESNSSVKVNIFIDTILVDESLDLKQIKEIFFTGEEEEMLVIQYGVLSSEINLMEELSANKADDSFEYDYCDDNVSDNYMFPLDFTDMDEELSPVLNEASDLMNKFDISDINSTATTKVS